MRESSDLRRYFNVKLCNSNRKVTGQASASLVTTEAQNVYNKIMQKMSAGDYGDESENDSTESENEIKDEDDNCDPDGSDYLNEPSASQEIPAYTQGNKADEEDVIAPAIAIGAPSTIIAALKRKRVPDDDDYVGGEKTKNSKPKNPRGALANTLKGMVENVNNSQNSSLMMQMFQIMQKNQAPPPPPVDSTGALVQMMMLQIVQKMAASMELLPTANAPAMPHCTPAPAEYVARQHMAMSSNSSSSSSSSIPPAYPRYYDGYEETSPVPIRKEKRSYD